MNETAAVVVDPAVAGRLSIQQVARPTAGLSEALVRVSAISLNRGEVRRSMSAEAGWRPGWDLAGVVEQAAADGSGPAVGTRVVGFVISGAWAELVAVPTNALAELPPGVTDAQAATLPVAGLTALYALEKGGLLLERPVLMTGATGGVGLYACQLAHLAGARVTALARTAQRAQLLKEQGADRVVVAEDAAGAREHGPFWLILESVGGRTLSQALGMLAPEGICVSLGVSAAAEVTFNAAAFYGTGGASLYGFILFHELRHAPASSGLTRLLRLIADGRLRPFIEVEAPWTQVGAVAQRLLDRGYAGKAVLHILP